MRYFKQILLFVFLFTFITAPTLAQDPSRFIDKNEVDEFTGNKVVTSKSSEVSVLQNNGERVSFAGGFVYYMEGNYILIIDVQSDGWNFLDSDTAYFVIDGKRYEKTLHKGESEMQTSGSSVSLYERLIIRLNRDFRTSLENATEAKVKAGSVVFNIAPAIDDEVWAVEQMVNSSSNN